MSFLKIKLLVISAIMFAASSAFASFQYNVTVDTSSFVGQTDYLYLQYTPMNAVASSATVSNFTMTGGALGAQDTIDVVNGSAVTGTLPGSVVFANTNGINDYNHAITLGQSLSFLVSFASTPGGMVGGASTFSLGLFGDALGSTSILNPYDANVPGTALEINLNNNGTGNAVSLDSTTSASPTPIPAAAWLLGSGLMGLAGIRRRMNG